MDKTEAIKRIKDHIRVHHIGEYPHILIAEALSMAIQALATDTNVGDKEEVVRCKDCKRWIPEQPERCKALKQEPYGLCNRYPQRTDWQDTTDHDDFCSYGERKNNG